MCQIQKGKTTLALILLILISLLVTGLRIIIPVTGKNESKMQILVPPDVDKTINHLLIEESML